VKLIHKNNWKNLVALSLLCSFATKYFCCRYNLIYISMVLAGAGFLLPYNSLISAVDFYKVTKSSFFKETVYTVSSKHFTNIKK
jgi:hypothetical protein